MAITSPIISWEAVVSQSTTHTVQYQYTCKLVKNNPNDEGYGDLQIGYYLVDNVGHIFEIVSLNYGGDSESVVVKDLLTLEGFEGPYNGKIGYVYASLYQAATVAQAKLNRLDESAEDFIRNLGTDPTVINAVQFNASYDPSGETVAEGLVHWNSNDNTMDLHTGYGTTLQVGQEIHIKVYNNTGSSISDGAVVYPTGAFNDYPTIGLAKTDTHASVSVDYGMTTTSIDDGEYGFVTWFGKVRGIDTSMFNLGDQLYISDINAGEVTNIRPSFPSYAIQIGIVFIKNADDGQVFVTSRDTVKDTFQNFWNGVFRESIDFTVSSNGTVVTGSLVPSNGHPDLTMLFSDGFSTLDTSPAKTIVLTPGTNTVPVENFVYVLQSTKALAASTVDWPAAEHIKVASIVLKSAFTTVTEDALKNQNWNDHLQDTDTNQGHLSHIGKAIRRKIPASYESGIDLTTTIVTASTPDDVYISTTSGVVMQLHDQAFPALNMQSGALLQVVNNFATPYLPITNINTQTLDALGNAISNKSFSTVTWGLANKSGETSHLMFNLPTGSYPKNSPALAVSDAYNYSVYDIPAMFQGVGFLIARHIWVLDAAGTGWILHETEDLRGKVPNTTAGGGAGGGVGATTYLGLTDTDSTYIGQATKVPQVNSTETGLEFVDPITLDQDYLNRIVTQTTHGFNNDFVYYNGTTWIKAQSNTAASCATHFAINLTTDTFSLTSVGEVNSTGITTDISGALVSGKFYFLSQTVAGKMTAIKPTSGITQAVFIENESNEGSVSIQEPYDITDVGGDMVSDLKTKVSDYTVTGNDYGILIDATSNTVTISLPASPDQGRIYNVKCINTTFTCTISGNGKTIDGAASKVLLLYESLTMHYDNTFGWAII